MVGVGLLSVTCTAADTLRSNGGGYLVDAGCYGSVGNAEDKAMYGDAWSPASEHNATWTYSSEEALKG